MIGGRAWLLWGGHVWLIWGGMRGWSGGHAWLLGGMCMVDPGDVHGCSGGHACVGYDEIRRYGQWAGSTHPTGMHSCTIYYIGAHAYLSFLSGTFCLFYSWNIFRFLASWQFVWFTEPKIHLLSISFTFAICFLWTHVHLSFKPFTFPL